MSSLITGWILALALGVRHASEPDHLVAVSTLVAGAPNTRRAVVLGAIWGIGHSVALLTVGGVLMFSHWQMPERLADLFELAVAFMLLFLGARSIRRAMHLRKHERETPATVQHQHRHQHAARRPLAIGLVHGLAGSGALTALALANMPSLGSGIVYMAFFGLGSVVGMAMLSGLIGAPLSRFTQKLRFQVAALATTGVLSLVVGVAWGWPLLWRVGAG